VDVAGPDAPGPYFQKGFFHNGYIKSLKQLVHFYNTRDFFSFPVTSGHCPAGKTEKADCWPQPEDKNNLDVTTGNLGLTDQEENQLVIFLQALTDGFSTPYPNVNTLYRHLHERWFGVHPRERVPDPDADSPALRIGYLRRPATPDYARSIAIMAAANGGTSALQPGAPI
jgi:hypothetical protein